MNSQVSYKHKVVELQAFLYICQQKIRSFFLQQASVPVTADKWFFVTSTFSKNTGLDLYVDGEVTASDKTGTVGAEHVLFTQPKNFFLGRNAAADGSLFGKFSMASFVTFKEVLSAASVGAVYSYFWRRGQ